LIFGATIQQQNNKNFAAVHIAFISYVHLWISGINACEQNSDFSSCLIQNRVPLHFTEKTFSVLQGYSLTNHTNIIFLKCNFKTTLSSLPYNANLLTSKQS